MRNNLNAKELATALKNIIDPEVGFDIVSLGLIYDINVDKCGNATITMTLSTKACPLHQLMPQWVYDVVIKNDNIKTCKINLVWEPAWNINMASKEVKQALKIR